MELEFVMVVPYTPPDTWPVPRPARMPLASLEFVPVPASPQSIVPPVISNSPERMS